MAKIESSFYSYKDEAKLQSDIDEKIELHDKNGEKVRFVCILEVSQRFIIFYNPKDNTLPPPKDLQRDIHTDVPPYNPSPVQQRMPSIVELARQYYIVTICLLGLVVYYFFLR